MQSLTCKTPSRTYLIEIGPGLLTSLPSRWKGIADRLVIVSDENVAKLYGAVLAASLNQQGLQTVLVTFPAGETAKTRRTKEVLEDQMLAHGLGRDTCLLALGGGVVTDLAGFLAATYCRGIPLIMMPTSLLAMVDGCIGGKNGVNVPEGKNRIGTIYQPTAIYMDTQTLQSLPKQERRQGVAEMIKHGLIADPAYFTYLETHAKALLTLDPEIMMQAIIESCRIKIAHVEQDERDDRGPRQLLNFGHTIGHALEQNSHYGISHGDAVAIGILAESYLSNQLGLLPASSFARIEKLLLAYDMPLKLPKNFSKEGMLEAMRVDKKSLLGQLCFVLLRDIGHPLHSQIIKKEALESTLHWMSNALRSH